MASAYREPAQALDKVLSRRSSLRNAAYATKDPPRCLALISAVLQNKDALQGALEATRPELLSQRNRKSVALIATFDAVAGKGLPRRAGGKLLRTLKENREQIAAAYFGLGGRSDSSAKKRRRFARLNPLRRRREGGIEGFERDPHVVDLFEFSPAMAKTFNGSHELVSSGQFILQDKPSCFPAEILIREAEKQPKAILDCCAAPGNKTTHAAALVFDEGGQVRALDRDPERLALLKRRVDLAGATNVTCVLADFLTFNDFEPDAILLDPSCSGSGIVDERRPSSFAEKKVDGLVAFQLEALTRALTQFSTVNRVVYSTCSVDDRENEDVVARALRGAGGDRFQLKRCMPTWQRRGRPHPNLSESESDALIRVDPAEDQITGFFVALFVRRQPTTKARLKARLRNKKRALR